jgi:hypothetical protein
MSGTDHRNTSRAVIKALPGKGAIRTQRVNAARLPFPASIPWEVLVLIGLTLMLLFWRTPPARFSETLPRTEDLNHSLYLRFPAGSRNL